MTAPNKGMRFPAEVLTRDEVAALIGACSAKARTGIRNRALLTLMYRSGLRVGETVALKPANVNLTTHDIRLLATKAGRAQTRGIHPSADDAILRWLDTRKDLSIKGGTLFCRLDGGRMSEQYVRHLIQRLGGRAGIDKRVHPHMLRHTFAYELHRGGQPLAVISKLLGHSNLTVTARYLDHLTNGEAVAALETADLPSLPGDWAEPEPPPVPAWVFAAVGQGAGAEAIAEAAGIDVAVIRKALEPAGR